MQCEEFEVQLNEALDRRMPLTAVEALAHQRVCSACRQRASAYGLIARELPQVSLPALSDDLTQRVLAEVRRPVVLPFRRRRRAALVLAAAATLLVAVIGVQLMSRSDFGPAAGQQVAGKNDQSLEKGRHASSPQQAKSARSNSVASTATKQSTSELSSAIAPSISDTATLPAAEWAQQVADGLQPVTRPTLGAATGFLQVWGVGQKRPPSGEGPRS